MGNLIKRKNDSHIKEAEQLAYFISHDLKAPLRAVDTLVNFIVEEATAGNKINVKYVDLLHARLKRMNDMINGLQELSNIGHTHTKDEVISLEDMLKEFDVLDNIQLIFNEMPVITANPTRIYQIFSNLVVNAIKHHHDPDNIKIEISGKDLGDFWEFSVQDNGPGIAAKEHKRIFEIFQTIKSKDEVEGNGLGLALIKKIITQYVGNIRLESELGKGSTFIFTIKKKSPTPAG